VTEPRALAQIFEKAEASLASMLHPDPYIRESPLLLHVKSFETNLFLAAPSMPGGTKWCVSKLLFSYLSVVKSNVPSGNAIFPYAEGFSLVFTILTIPFTAYNCSFIRPHSCRASLNAVYLLQHPIHSFLSNTSSARELRFCVAQRTPCYGIMPVLKVAVSSDLSVASSLWFYL